VEVTRLKLKKKDCSIQNFDDRVDMDKASGSTAENIKTSANEILGQY
jgi:hypothetical protein